MGSIIDKLENSEVFTPVEAWKIYKIVAIAEAFGWTTLITGILVSHYGLVSSKVAIPIAGQIHGTIFVGYFLILIFVYPSLKWKRTTFLIALLAGIPPYGSLIFEIWANHHQRQLANNKAKVVAIIRMKDKIIGIQPCKGIDWELPSTLIEGHETPEAAMKRLLGSLFKVNSYNYKRYVKKKNDDKDDIYFKINDPRAYFKLNLLKITKEARFIDEVAILKKDEAPELFI